MSKETAIYDIGHLRYQNAFATEPCLGCKGTGEQIHFPAPQTAETINCDCVDAQPGSGRIYVLNGVRESCPRECKVGYDICDCVEPCYNGERQRICPSCQGQGEVPVEDGWLEAWASAGGEFTLRIRRAHPLSYIPPEKRFYAEASMGEASGYGWGRTEDEAKMQAFHAALSQIPGVEFREDGRWR